MDQKLVALSALCLFARDGSPIAENAIRHLRTVLSLFLEEILAEDEYQQLLESLQDEGLVRKRGDKVVVTRQGVALMHAIGERMLGQTDFDRLRKMVADYVSDGDEYIRRLQEQLKALEKTRETKFQAASGSLIRAVGLIMRLHHKYSDLFVSSFELTLAMMRSEDSLDREIGYAARNYTRTTGLPIIPQREGNLLQITSLKKIDTFQLFDQNLPVSVVETVRRQAGLNWNQSIASVFMENSLRELGYVRSRWPGRAFTKFREFRKVQTNIGRIRECESLGLDFKVQGDQALVWVESFTSPTKRVLDFLRENISDPTDTQEMLACLNGLTLRSIPSGGQVTLKRILSARNVTLEQIPGTGQTFANYWERVHRITLAETTQPILVAEGKNTELHYPSEMVYIDRNSLRKRLGRSMTRKPRPESPEERYTKLQTLFRLIQRLQPCSLNEYVEIELERCAPKARELVKLGAIERALRIRQPMIEFQGGTSSLDPLDIFLADHTPVCGRKDISITHLVLPDGVTQKDTDTFVQGLHRRFNAYGFGSIQKDKNATVLKYDLSAAIEELGAKIRDLSKTKRSNNLAIAIVPDDSPSHYYSLKRLLPARAGVPLQCVRSSSFGDILAGRFRGYKNLCIKILIKSLKEGESVWNLCSAAGLLSDKTLFVGIGFSRYPREGRVSKCAAVLHDARGARVSWEVFSTLQERAISKQWFDILLRKIGDIVKEERPSRLLFYRTGLMYPQELEAVQSSLQNCSWLSSVKVSFVSIMDAHNPRFYLYYNRTSRYQNPPAGYTLILNDKEALLSTSNYDDRELRQGTVIPIHLKLEFGDEDIIDLVKEYHDLTYLNWRAPAVTGKHPLVLTLAERFAELTREGIPAESMFYLDL